jgi:hypothetical protein
MADRLPPALLVGSGAVTVHVLFTGDQITESGPVLSSDIAERQVQSKYGLSIK